MMSRCVPTAEVSLSLHEGEQSSLCSFFVFAARAQFLTAKVAEKIRRGREEKLALTLETVSSFAIDGYGFGYF
jgi:hypothetical protein